MVVVVVVVVPLVILPSCKQPTRLCRKAKNERSVMICAPCYSSPSRTLANNSPKIIHNSSSNSQTLHLVPIPLLSCRRCLKPAPTTSLVHPFVLPLFCPELQPTGPAASRNQFNLSDTVSGPSTLDCRSPLLLQS
jgi:hypothetical protein